MAKNEFTTPRHRADARRCPRHLRKICILIGSVPPILYPLPTAHARKMTVIWLEWTLLRVIPNQGLSSFCVGPLRSLTLGTVRFIYVRHFSASSSFTLATSIKTLVRNGPKRTFELNTSSFLARNTMPLYMFRVREALRA